MYSRTNFICNVHRIAVCAQQRRCVFSFHADAVATRIFLDSQWVRTKLPNEAVVSIPIIGSRYIQAVVKRATYVLDSSLEYGL